jgi:hypothetical protein
MRDDEERCSECGGSGRKRLDPTNEATSSVDGTFEALFYGGVGCAVLCGIFYGLLSFTHWLAN